MRLIKFFNFFRLFHSGHVGHYDKIALRSFLHNFHWGEDLSDSEAKANLEQGIVELIDNKGNHLANGLLITTNGYFVTSYHCVNDADTYQSYIRCADNRICPVKKVLRYNERSDIAVVKADIPTTGPAQAFRYRFKDQTKFRGLPVIVQLSRRSGKLVKKGGYLYALKTHTLLREGGEEVDNQLLVSIDAVRGDSGGVITTLKYQVCGVHRGGWEDTKHGSCTFFYKALELICNLTQNK